MSNLAIKLQHLINIYIQGTSSCTNTVLLKTLHKNLQHISQADRRRLLAQCYRTKKSSLRERSRAVVIWLILTLAV